MINELYTNSASITLDDLLALRPLLPTPEEKNIFRLAGKISTLNPNSPAEAFMVAMSTCPSLSWIVDTMIMQRQFDPDYFEIKRLLTGVKVALITLKDSTIIKQLLRIILEGCQLATLEFGRSKTQKQQILMKGATKGFRMSTLSRLQDFRSENGQKSMLHFIAEALSLEAVEKLKEIRGIISEPKGTDISLLRGSLHELKLSVESTKAGPPFGSDTGRLSKYLLSIDSWIVEKNLLIVELHSLFSAFESILDDVLTYFGEDGTPLSNDEIDNNSSSISTANTEEFLKLWDEFLKELLDAYCRVELEKHSASFAATATTKYRFSHTFNLKEANYHTSDIYNISSRNSIEDLLALSSLGD